MMTHLFAFTAHHIFCKEILLLNQRQEEDLESSDHHFEWICTQQQFKVSNTTFLSAAHLSTFCH